MRKNILLLLCMCLAACSPHLRLSSVAGTQPSDFSWYCEQQFSNGQPAQKTVVPEELDVRSCDVSTSDFSAYSADELADVLNFNSKTKFPPADKLPKGFFSQKKFTARYVVNPTSLINHLQKLSQSY